MLQQLLDARLVDKNRPRVLYPHLAAVQGANWQEVGEIAFVDYDEPEIKDLNRYRTAIAAPEILEISEQAWTPDTRIYFNFQIDLDEQRGKFDHLYQRVEDAGKLFTQRKDKDMFELYPQAGVVIDDGMMTIGGATNGGAGNPIELTRETVGDFITNLYTFFEDNNIPVEDRFITVKPIHYSLIKEYNTKTYWGTETGVESGSTVRMIDINGIKVHSSNNIVTEAGVVHGLAGQGKQIFMWEVIGGRTYVSDIENNTTHFAKLVKGTTMYGYIVPNRRRQNFFDLQIKA